MLPRPIAADDAPPRFQTLPTLTRRRENGDCGFLSQARWTFATGRLLGRRCAVSVEDHVAAKDEAASDVVDPSGIVNAVAGWAGGAVSVDVDAIPKDEWLFML